jgi:hypothetical protein
VERAASKGRLVGRGEPAGTDVLDRPELSVPVRPVKIVDRLVPRLQEADGNNAAHDRIPFDLTRDLPTTANAAEESPG